MGRLPSTLILYDFPQISIGKMKKDKILSKERSKDFSCKNRPPDREKKTASPGGEAASVIS